MSACLYAVQSALYLTHIRPAGDRNARIRRGPCCDVARIFARWIRAIRLHAFVVVAGLLSLQHQRSIVPGKFVRSITDPVQPRALRPAGLEASGSTIDRGSRTK